MPIDASVVARVLGVETSFVNLLGSGVFLLPQQVALLGQGSTLSTYSVVPAKFTTAAAVGALYGFGSPLHLAALKLLPPAGGGLGSIPLTVYPFVDGAGNAAAGDITPAGVHAGAAEYRVVMNGIRSKAFTIADAEGFAALKTRITAAINGEVNMPCVAVDGAGDEVDLTSKWVGISSNDITVSVEGPSQGITFAFTQPTGGTVDPDVDLQLVNITSKWETLLVSCFPIGTEAELDKYELWGEPRWGALVRKPTHVITGSSETTVATLTAIGATRKADRTNALVWAPGAVELPCQIAAAGALRIAKQANNNPPVDYAGQLIDVTPSLVGADPLTFAERDTAVQAGLSTTLQTDSAVFLEDTVTFYHPDGEVPPAHRYVVDNVKLQQLIYNLTLIFEADEGKGAPLIPDNQATTNKAARKPKDAIAAVARMVDGAGLAAIISDPEGAKKTITAVIDGTNPKRLNVAVTVQISGNSNVIDVALNFGFFFGSPIVV